MVCRRPFVGLSVAVLTVCAFCMTDVSARSSAEPDVAFEPHARIVIMGDEDFTSENGVRTGSGTTLDPYIIEGWEIDLSESPGPNQYSDGIVVQNTEARFVIRDMWIHSGLEAETTDGSMGSWSAIMMYNVRLATVEDCALSNNSIGIHAMLCSWVSVVGCLIADNHFTGVFTDRCEFVKIRDCVIARNYGGGVEFGNAQNCDVADSTVTGCEHWMGVNLYDAKYCSVRNCNVTYNSGVGVNIGFSEDCNVSGNLFEGNDIGACVYGTERITMESNVFLDNDEDIRDDSESQTYWIPAILIVVTVATMIAIALFLDRRIRLKGRPK